MNRGTVKSKFKKYCVYLRDGFRCVYCGEQLSKKTATVDHLTCRSQGGSDESWNLVTSCGPCNVERNTTPIEKYADEKTLEKIRTLTSRGIGRFRKKANRMIIAHERTNNLSEIVTTGR